MQRRSQSFCTAEEHSDIRIRVLVLDVLEDAIPMWSTVVRRRAELRHCISFATDVADHDVGELVFFHFVGQVCKFAR